MRLEGLYSVPKGKNWPHAFTLSLAHTHTLVIKQCPVITPLEHVHALCEPAQLAAQPRELVASAPLGLAGRHGLLRRGWRG